MHAGQQSDTVSCGPGTPAASRRKAIFSPPVSGIRTTIPFGSSLCSEGLLWFSITSFLCRNVLISEEIVICVFSGFPKESC